MARPISNREKRIRKVSVYLNQTEFNKLELATKDTDKTKFIVTSMMEKITKLEKERVDDD